MLRKSSASLEYQFSNTHLTEYITCLREEYTLGKKIALIQAPQFLFDSFKIINTEYKKASKNFPFWS